ncbi:MAG TPA: hypothetical protein DCO75_13445 [Fibrobacteres bacterium]|jgi:site-specific recombinase XerD|nr:hypothetical protein [Fibrobacterota bacterium]
MSKNVDNTTIAVISTGDIRQEFDLFMVDRQTRDLSASTLDFYRREFEPFLRYLNSNGIFNIRDIRPSDIRAFFLEQSKKRNPGGIHSHFRVIRAFLLWWEKETEPANWSNPVKKISPPKNKLDPIPGISIEDIQKMLKVCGNNKGGQRDRLILLTLLDTGARASEFCALKAGDLDLQTGAVIIKHGKGDKPRIVYVGKKTLKELTRYLRESGATLDQPLFPNRHGQPLTRNGLV